MQHVVRYLVLMCVQTIFNALQLWYVVLGKSDLMDAISFVLGEKTSNLRVRSLKVNLLLP